MPVAGPDERLELIEGEIMVGLRLRCTLAV
jgi:hypothetical protein